MDKHWGESMIQEHIKLLEVKGLSQTYALPRSTWFEPKASLQALHRIDFELASGKSLGIVGESGSGKSTLARLIMALEKPSEGKVIFKGHDLNALTPHQLREIRPQFQMVFQDPYSALDPRQTVLQIVSEPLHGKTKKEMKELAEASLAEVGLRSSDLDKYPHEFSGGQRQRIAIARALITRPSLIVADEPLSALDVSVQAQVLNLMMDLQDKHGLSYVLVSHDLAVVNLMCDDVMVLQDGVMVEYASSEELFKNPQHPCTQKLLSAVPGLNRLPF
jgi:peptide/nickel transport system ATP-binding protein